jgi:hypothetical protein
MNTPRILDIVPASAASNAPPGSLQAPRAKPVIPEIRAGSAQGEDVPDAARKRVDAERRRFEPAAVEPAQRDQPDLAEQIRQSQNFSSRVGYFDGSSMVFVDLIDAKTQRELFRIFGPRNHPAPDPAEARSPARAAEAYGGGAGRRHGEAAIVA